MKPRRKWLTGVGLFFGALALLLVFLYQFALPIFVERQIRIALEERGFGDAAFSLEAVGLSQLQLSNIQLDRANTISAARIEVDYGLGDLWAGRVSEVRISRARLKLRLAAHSRVDWQSLARLFERKGGGPPSLQRLRWLDSTLVLETPVQRIAIPLSGSLEQAAGETRVAVSGRLQGEPVHLDLIAQKRGRAARVWSELVGSGAGAGYRNRLSISALVESAGERSITLYARGRWKGLRSASLAPDWHLGELQGLLELYVLGAEVVEARGEVSLASMKGPSLHMQDSRITLARGRDALALEVSTRLEELRASLTARMGTRPLEYQFSEPFYAQWRAEGPAPSLLLTRLTSAGVSTNALQLNEASGSAMFKASGADSSWQLIIPNGQARLSARRISMPKHRLSLNRPGATLAFELRATDSGGALSMHPATQVQARALRWRDLSMQPTVRSTPVVQLRVSSRAAQLRWGGLGPAWNAGALVAELRSNLGYAERARVRNLRGSLRLRQAPRAAAPRLLRSRLRSDEVRVDGFVLPALSATLNGELEDLRIGVDAPVTRSANLSAQVRILRRGRRIRCPSQVRLPRATLRKDDLLAQVLEERFALVLRGDLALTARGDPCTPQDRGEARLTLADARLDAFEDSLELSGLQGELALSSLRPLEASQWQEMRWKQLRVGEQSLGSGRVRARARSRRVLEIQELRLQLEGGQLWCAPFSFAPGNAKIDTTLYARDIPVQRWVPLLSRGRARGSGRISGELTLHLRLQPSVQLQLEQGHLRAVGPGRFVVTDRKWLQQALLRHSTGFGLRSDKTDVVKDRVLGALLDFRYTLLEATITPSRPPLLSIAVQGKGQRIPQELDLRLNVRGFNELIKPGLRAWLLK